ncbi:MAG: patatin-like phospholipase family protein [Verrucomicrobia bacterium]|nr:patatin-like phospholipase family protein [Verrucomicrobiota bacterium]MBS0637361.1 patatin-like phospholipase family protein [Verrucomicrobiota bacterium]
MFDAKIAVQKFPAVVLEAPLKPIEVPNTLVGKIKAFVVQIFETISSWFHTQPPQTASYRVSVHRDKKFDLHPNPYIIFCFDGGGVRGKASAEMAVVLEEEIGRPLNQVADMLAGTSAGAINASLLSRGHTAKQASGFFDTFAADVFSTSFLHRLDSLWGIFAAKYASPRAIMSSIIEDMPLTQSLTDLLITSVDVNTGDTVPFDNTMENVSYVDAVEASTAAPTYFPTAVVNGKNLMDGGVAANNPILYAVKRALTTVEQDRPILAVSIGAGKAKHPPLQSKEVINGGLVHWGLPMLDYWFETQEENTDTSMNALAQSDPRISYVRIQMILDNVSKLDDSSPENLRHLAEAGRRCIRDFLDNGGYDRVVTPCKEKPVEPTK